MLSEELTALHQGDGVGVYFRDVVPILVGQANKANSKIAKEKNMWYF
jgi:hypothetical protein